MQIWQRTKGEQCRGPSTPPTDSSGNRLAPLRMTEINVCYGEQSVCSRSQKYKRNYFPMAAFTAGGNWFTRLRNMLVFQMYSSVATLPQAGIPVQRTPCLTP